MCIRDSISLSHPIFSADKRYLGYVAGTIYLGSASVLSSLLGQHYYQDGSYLYVVDRQRTLIYHCLLYTSRCV